MKLLFTSLILILPALSFAQSIEYDYDSKTNTITAKSKIEPNKGDSYYIKLNKVNTAYYQVKINPVQSNFKSTIPDILKSVLPGISTSDISILNIHQLQSIPGVPLIPSNYYEKIQSVFNDAAEEFNKLQELVEINNSLKAYIITNKDDYNLCKQKALPEITKVCTMFSNAANKKTLKENINISIHSFIASWATAKTMIETAPGANPEKLVDLLKDFNLYNQFVIDNQDKFLGIVDFLYSTSTAEEDIKSSMFKNLKDKTTINFLILNKLSGDTILKSKEELFSSKGWKLDFTTGFFYNNLFSKDYYLTTINNEKKILEEDSQNFDIAIGAMAHLTYRVTSSFKVGPGLGVALSPLDGKTRYLFGLTTILGRKNQLAINFGPALSKVKQLSGKISLDGKNQVDPLSADVTSVTTYEKMKWGGFLGLTYNLTANP